MAVLRISWFIYEMIKAHLDVSWFSLKSLSASSRIEFSRVNRSAIQWLEGKVGLNKMRTKSAVFIQIGKDTGATDRSYTVQSNQEVCTVSASTGSTASMKSHSWCLNCTGKMNTYFITFISTWWACVIFLVITASLPLLRKQSELHYVFLILYNTGF